MNRQSKRGKAKPFFGELEKPKGKRPVKKEKYAHPNYWLSVAGEELAFPDTELVEEEDSLRQESELFEPVVEQMLEQEYAVIDGFLSKEEAAHLLKSSREAYQNGDFHLAGIGKGEQFQKNREIRNDRIMWLDHHNPKAENFVFFDRLKQMIDYLNQTCYLGIRDMEFHFTIYPKGSLYKRHLDVFTTDSARKLSAICYLNPDWEAADGGQLRLYLPDDKGKEMAKDILPEAGRLVIFNSQKIEHEVMPTERERYSITGWLKDQASLI